MSKKVLIVDDEANIVNIIAFNLKKEGFAVVNAFDGEQGLNLAFSENPDIILLDVMMPKLDGFEVCKKIREKLQTPIIMLTARAEEADKIFGLEIGADDYVSKPFSVNELIARVKANLRRFDVPQQSEQESFVFKDLRMDFNKYEVFCHDQLVALTPKEFELLKFLALHNENIFSRDELLQKVWGYEYFGDARTVDVTVRRLRMKIEDVPDNPKYIMTKRGVGYYFNMN